MPLQDVSLLRLAFSMIRGLKLHSAQALMDKVGDINNFFSATPAALKALTGLKDSLVSDEYRRELLLQAREELIFIQKNSIKVSLSFDDAIEQIPASTTWQIAYPIRLKQCDDAPAVLYSLGDFDSDKYRTVGIVGTRHASSYGVDFTTRLVSTLAQKVDNIAIISGLAYGIDVAAHRAALAAGIPTAAVLAHPLNTLYPPEHRGVAKDILNHGGALISEYSTAQSIHRSNFLARNRIVSGLCDCIIVVESDVRGGAMNTARIAREYNRDVMAVPGRVSDKYSSGCLKLISENVAALITDAHDVIRLMGWPYDKDEGFQRELPIDIPPLHLQKVLDYIASCTGDGCTVSEMCIALDLPYNELSDRLLSLELNDYIVAAPGGKYRPLRR